MPDTPAPPEPTAQEVRELMRSRRYVGLLVVAAVVGVIVSLVAWCFLEGVNQIQRELFTHLPSALGYHNGPPLWWYPPVLAIGALLAALAITRLPGDGGHLPAKGLAVGGGAPNPINLPGVILAGAATIGFGLLLGPEAPLIALGAGVAVLTLRLARTQMAPQVIVVIGAAGSFAALSFIFASPLIAAVILIEAAGIGGPRLPLIVLPGLLAAGIGSLVSLGMGSFTGLSSSAYALPSLQMPHFGQLDIGQFGWTIVLALGVAICVRLFMVLGLRTHGVVTRRMLLLLPLIGLVIAGLAIAFHGITGKSVNEVLFDGQAALPGLVSQAGTWSIGALLLVIAFKGVSYGLALGSYRGGPTFPAIYLGAAGGILASHLPGFPLTPAVAIGVGATVAAVLRLPVSGVLLATLLTASGGTGDEPLIIVGVVVTYVATLVVSELIPDPKSQEADVSAPPRPTGVPAAATAGASGAQP